MFGGLLLCNSPMRKNDYSTEIHALFEQIRSEIKVESPLGITRMEWLERDEKEALEENSRETIQRIKRRIAKEKKKTFVLPLAGKKYTILPSGKIKIEVL